MFLSKCYVLLNVLLKSLPYSSLFWYKNTKQLSTSMVHLSPYCFLIHNGLYDVIQYEWLQIALFLLCFHTMTKAASMHWAEPASTHLLGCLSSLVSAYSRQRVFVNAWPPSHFLKVYFKSHVHGCMNFHQKPHTAAGCVPLLLSINVHCFWSCEAMVGKRLKRVSNLPLRASLEQRKFYTERVFILVSMNILKLS